jgi:hypothetical protein
MKNTPIDPYAAQDIGDQVDKILRGLGNPEPPLDLRDVRELLKLDRQFYSAAQTGPLEEFVSRVKIGAKQLAKRPTLILEVVRKAKLRALWLPDRKRILIDEDIPDLKKRHAEGHEIIHGIAAHHAPFLYGDDGETLRHSCHEKLEAEANFGSGQLLFLRTRFIEKAQDLPLTIGTARALAKTFGNTITMTLWRLIEEAHKGTPTFGLVSVHPKLLSADFDPLNPCKHFIESPDFRDRFGSVTEIEAFGVVQGYASRARGGPLGETDVVLIGRDGGRHRFHMETFFNRHEALTLGTYLGPVRLQVVVPEKLSPMSEFRGLTGRRK